MLMLPVADMNGQMPPIAAVGRPAPPRSMPLRHPVAPIPPAPEQRLFSSAKRDSNEPRPLFPRERRWERRRRDRPPFSAAEQLPRRYDFTLAYTLEKRCLR
jgi:hypothetical protein